MKLVFLNEKGKLEVKGEGVGVGGRGGVGRVGRET